MSIATADSPSEVGESHFVIHNLGYEAYVALQEALGEDGGVRLTFVDGRLTLLTSSRQHEWFVKRLAELVKAVALATSIDWEDAGSTTLRRREKEVGVEGDETFYFGEHARLMKGPVNIDLSTQPPPDLAIEVEVSHPADDAILVYGRLGVPEVWRFDVDSSTFSICLRNEDGTYSVAGRSRSLPVLEVADLLDQLKLAEVMGAGGWNVQLGEWIRTTILPRLIEGRG